jgi:uncharacterized protein YneF (UPF0154 family)
MRKYFLVVLLAFLIIWSLSGCATTARYSPEEIKDFPPMVQEQIRAGNVAIGMTPQQVRYAWGPPTALNVLAPTHDGKTKEEWIYSTWGIFMQRRLLFVEGKLVDIFPESKPQSPQQEPAQQGQQEQPGEKK